jgi:hypothetical protein
MRAAVYPCRERGPRPADDAPGAPCAYCSAGWMRLPIDVLPTRYPIRHDQVLLNVALSHAPSTGHWRRVAVAEGQRPQDVLEPMRDRGPRP